METELREKGDELTETFKQRVFAANPPLYRDIFETPDEPDITEFEPQSEADLIRMREELRRLGFD